MIRYLHKLKNKKGFTMAELIIVIAIIAILSAMVFPMFSNDDARRTAVNTYASDFYSSLQYCMTRYQKTDYHINTEMAAEAEIYKADPTKNPVIIYDANAGQNVLIMPTGVTSYNLYIEAYYDKGLKYVKVGNSLESLLMDTATTSDIAFERQLEKDLDEIINDADNGYYYAVVNFDTSKYSNFKVLSAHFCEEKLPAYTGDTSYRDNLMFIDNSELQCGIICGSCSTDQNSAGNYIGNLGSHLLNVGNVQDNAVVEYP